MAHQGVSNLFRKITRQSSSLVNLCELLPFKFWFFAESFGLP